MSLKNIPNLITVSRILLLFPLSYYLYQQSYSTALLLFLIAGLSDGLDGILARSFHWTSRFGAIADPIADKLLMLVSYSLLTLQNILPLWLLLIVVGRDLFIVIGAWYLHHAEPNIKLLPTLLSKLNTTLQIVLVTVVMFALVWSVIPDVLSKTLIVLVVLTSISSGIQYLFIGLKLKKKYQIRKGE